MQAPVDRSDARELVFANPRAWTFEALAASAGRAMRRRPPPDRALYPQGTPMVRRALADLRTSQPRVAEAFDEASLLAAAAQRGGACRWCRAFLLAAVHGLPWPRLTPQNAALLDPICPECPRLQSRLVMRRRGLVASAEGPDHDLEVARRVNRMVREGIRRMLDDARRGIA